MKNYTKLEEKYIEEIQSDVTIYRHDKSGARVCTLKNDDNNKVFSIAFRTPPINDCGLTHILEHSVLCGSKKYPVKDPFVELLKSSLNTFLNAFTFPDKTMYPLASQNEKDFKNLMSVYMDAVFYPAIYQHKEIFMQEGWHYHLEKKEDPITINGVVYNEMKGAFSDPQQSLFSKIMLALFPNTAYHYESGGDPKYIPELSYETFKNFHSKFYHPSNSYIIIYGNCDMDERMEWLDNEYLSKFDVIDFDTRLTYEKPFLSPVYKTYPYPVGKDEDKEGKSFLSYNVVFPTSLDQKLTIATSILMNALFDVPGAPLKQALLDANLAADVSSYFEEDVLQPMAGVIAAMADEKNEAKFISIIEDELSKILAEGLDKKALLALINHAEFAARERAFSSRSPQGLNVAMAVMAGWLYDDTKPCCKLEVLQYYKELKEEVNNGYFENIIRTYFLSNTHKAFVKLVPSDTYNEEKEHELTDKLASYKASLTDSEIESLIAECKHLSDYQSSEDTPEAVNTLPKLALSDINPDPEKYNLEVKEGKYKVLYSSYPTNEISYIKYYFDISGLNQEDLLYAGLYTDLFTQLSTSKHSYYEINQIIQSDLGTFHSSIQNLKTYTSHEAKIYLTYSFSALTKNVKLANDLLLEVINDTDFEDEKRLAEYLAEMKSNLEMSISDRGHSFAMNRAMSYIDEYSFNMETVTGVTYIDFISDLSTHFEEKKNEIISHLKNVKKMLMSKNTFFAGFTGSDADLTSSMPVMDSFYESLEDTNTYNKSVFKENLKNEAFTASFDINFVARAGKFSGTYNGGMAVLQNSMSMDYLWMQARVHGGAYGCFMNIDPSGYIMFGSYRDPHIKNTSDIYENSYKFVEEFNPTEEQLLKFKIGAIGNSESVKHVRDKAEMARALYLKDLSFEERKKNRMSILTVTAEDIRGYAKYFKEAMDTYNICVVGNQNKINSHKDMFKTIRPVK